MKLFTVTYEQDGQTVKAPGITSTEIKKVQELYAAESMEQVWLATESIRDDPERTLVSIAEVAPLVTVLNAGSPDV